MISNELNDGRIVPSSNFEGQFYYADLFDRVSCCNSPLISSVHYDVNVHYSVGDIWYVKWTCWAVNM